jgi:hypothetical protein
MKTFKSLATCLLVAGTMAFAVTACKTDHHSGSATATAGAKPYPLNKCVVTDEALGADAYTFVRDGQEIKLCCKDCREEFDKDPKKFMAKLNGAK